MRAAVADRGFDLGEAWPAPRRGCGRGSRVLQLDGIQEVRHRLADRSPVRRHIVARLDQRVAERARIRAEAAKDANWPPKIREFVVDQDVEVLTPFPFVPEITPGTTGPIFEIRRYSLTPGSLAGVMKRWEGAIAERTKLSPLVLAGGVEFGGANRFIHIWAYKSMDQRMQVREQARKAGIWPPPGGGDELLAQSNKIVMPSAFSPLQ